VHPKEAQEPGPGTAKGGRLTLPRCLPAREPCACAPAPVECDAEKERAAAAGRGGADERCGRQPVCRV
jgi:hypothetical protein